MSETPQPPPEQPPQRPFSLARWLGGFWLGIVAFGAVNFALITLLASLSQIVAAPLLIGLVLVAAVAAYVTGRARPFAAGLVASYAVVSVASTGVCTLLVNNSGEDALGQLLLGVAVYVIALVAVGVAALVAIVVERVRASR